MRMLHRAALACILASTAAFSFCPSPVLAAEGLAIAAVVNDQVITTSDLDNRLRFILATTGIQDSAETRERLVPQVIRQLADEVLQMQEASRNAISVSDTEVDKAIAGIEEQRHIPSGQLIAHLKDLGIPPDTFRDQVRAQLAWSQIMGKKIRPQVRVSEEEIDRARLQVEEETTPKGIEADEVKISVLALPVEKPAQEPKMRALADKLMAEIQRGASFEAVARELAAGGASAAAPFWIKPAQLDPAIAQAIQKTANGSVTPPVRTADGYTIVQLLDRRGARSLGVEKVKDTEVLLKDVLLKLKDDAAQKEVKIMLQIGQEVSKHPGTCTEEGIAGVNNVEDFDISVAFRRTRTSEMTDAIRAITDKLKVGDVSQPFATPEGIRFFMLCERVDAPPRMYSHEETYNRLMQQKMMLEAQKYMRNLRRNATIEVRV